MPPIKPYDELKIGLQTQKNYGILEQLFDDKLNLRDTLWNMDEATLRAWVIAELQISLSPTDRIIIVDIENARFNKFNIPQSENYYLLVLPPLPRRHPYSEEYKDMQAWEGAWHHAIVDGYGM